MKCAGVTAIPQLCLALAFAASVLGGATPGTNPHPSDLPTINEDNDGHTDGPAVISDGYTEEAPPLVYAVRTEACDKYRYVRSFNKPAVVKLVHYYTESYMF